MRVAVIGLGAIGSQTLLHLSRHEGVDLVGYDRYSPGHGFGASGGENRLFGTVGDDYPGYQELLEYSVSTWEELERLGSRSILARPGYLVICDEPRAENNHMVRAARAAGSPGRILNREQLTDEFGFQRYFPGDVGVFDPTGGAIRTDAAIFEAVRVAEQAGARVRRDSTVTTIIEDSGGVTVEAQGEAIRYDLAIVTTGPWVHELLPQLQQVQVHRPTSAWFLPKRPETMRGLPALAREGANQFYAAPTFDGVSLKVGYSGTRQLNIPNGPRPADRLIDPDRLGEFPTILGECLTGFDPHPFRMAQFFEGYTKTSRPVLQRASDRLVIGAGFSGLGFKYSPVFGRLLAETALGGELSPMLRPVREQIPELEL